MTPPEGEQTGASRTLSRLLLLMVEYAPLVVKQQGGVMRIVIGLLLAVLLAGCGTRMNWTPPTPTPDVKTAAGYRSTLIQQVSALDTAVRTMNAACADGEIATCQQTVNEQVVPFGQSAQWIQTTTPPRVCLTVFSGYIALTDMGAAFLSDLQLALNQANKAAVIATVERRYPVYTKSKSVADQPIPNDACK